MTNRREDEQAFAGLVRDIESEMATRTRRLHRPLPWLGALGAGAVGAVVVLGILGITGSSALYATAIVTAIALLVGLVRLVVFDWLAEASGNDHVRPASEPRT